MTAAAEHPAPRAATTDGQLPTALASAVERIIAAVLGGWPAPPETGNTIPAPDPAIEEA